MPLTSTTDKESYNIFSLTNGKIFFSIWCWQNAFFENFSVKLCFSGRQNATYVLPGNFSKTAMETLLSRSQVACRTAKSHNRSKEDSVRRRRLWLWSITEQKHFIFAVGVNSLSNGSWKMVSSRVIGLGHLFVQGTKESRETSFASTKKKKNATSINSPCNVLSWRLSFVSEWNVHKTSIDKLERTKGEKIKTGCYYYASVTGKPSSELSHLGLFVSICISLAAAACQHFLSATPLG